eukprot:Skav234246  [mRNA]  locus=scaffold1464:556196:559820:+ [translate_table: standard]
MIVVHHAISTQRDQLLHDGLPHGLLLSFLTSLSHFFRCQGIGIHGNQLLRFQFPRENSRAQLRVLRMRQVGAQHPRVVPVVRSLGPAVAAPQQILHLHGDQIVRQLRWRRWDGRWRLPRRDGRRGTET